MLKKLTNYSWLYLITAWMSVSALAQGTQKLQVYLFGAGYCEPCGVELTKFESEANQVLGPEKMSRLSVTVYLVAGASAVDIATAAFAEQYKEDLQTHFAVEPDAFGHIYSNYFPNQTMLVPSYVVLDSSGNVVLTELPGETHQDLIDYLNWQLDRLGN